MAKEKDWAPKLESGLDFTKLELSGEEGFLLSRIDGATTVTHLTHLTGLPQGKIKRILGRLVEQGAVRKEDAPVELGGGSSARAQRPAKKARADKASEKKKERGKDRDDKDRPPPGLTEDAELRQDPLDDGLDEEDNLSGDHAADGPPTLLDEEPAASSASQPDSPEDAPAEEAPTRRDPIRKRRPPDEDEKAEENADRTSESDAEPVSADDAAASSAEQAPQDGGPDAEPRSEGGEDDELRDNPEHEARKDEVEDDVRKVDDAEGDGEDDQGRSDGEDEDGSQEADEGDGGGEDDEDDEDVPEEDERGRSWRRIFEEDYHPLDIDERVKVARVASGLALRALCYDPSPRVVQALLQNMKTGLQHGRLIAEHHRMAPGLDALGKRSAFLRDRQVQRFLFRNPQTSDRLFQRVMQPKRMMDVYRMTTNRDTTERVRKGSRKLFRAKFAQGTAEERVNLIIKCEGRCLAQLIGIAIDGRTIALLCGRAIHSTLLVQNLARWPGAPPPVLVHLGKQPIVKRSPMLKNLLIRHPNAPSQLKRLLK